MGFLSGYHRQELRRRERNIIQALAGLKGVDLWNAQRDLRRTQQDLLKNSAMDVCSFQPIEGALAHNGKTKKGGN